MLATENNPFSSSQLKMLLQKAISHLCDPNFDSSRELCILSDDVLTPASIMSRHLMKTLKSSSNFDGIVGVFFESSPSSLLFNE